MRKLLTPLLVGLGAALIATILCLFVFGGSILTLGRSSERDRVLHEVRKAALGGNEVAVLGYISAG